MITLPDIRDVKEIEGKRILVRLSLNVPLANDTVADDFRIEKSKGVVEWLTKRGAKVILLSHLGSDGEKSLYPVAQYLEQFFPTISFESSTDINQEFVKKTKSLDNGDVLLLENMRKHEGEQENDPSFAQDLALLGDIYVNEDFAVSHRKQASVVSLPHYLPSYAGPLLIHEVENLSKVLAPNPPFYLILGGAKISTKLPLVKKFIDVADGIFIYGALAHNMFRARGYEIGTSLIEEDLELDDVFRDKKIHDKKIHIPLDVIVRNAHGEREVKSPDAVTKDDMILDAGTKSLEDIERTIKGAHTILWNGPIGNFEEGFMDGTKQLAHIVGSHEAFSVVGGGDTISAIKELGMENDFGFISTGGGAMLDFLAKGTLPGITALIEKNL